MQTKSLIYMEKWTLIASRVSVADTLLSTMSSLSVNKASLSRSISSSFPNSIGSDNFPCLFFTRYATKHLCNLLFRQVKFRFKKLAFFLSRIVRILETTASGVFFFPVISPDINSS